MADEREFDIVFFGATGFTGRLVAEYFVSSVLPKEPDVKFAIAGRNREKLEVIKALLLKIDDSAEVNIIIASSKDMDSLVEMCQRTKVIISTVGPFLEYGSELVEACVNCKTHYCDITGETPWVKDMINKHHQKAIENETVIVPMCGFDSQPSDLSTLFLAEEAKKRNSRLKSIENVFTVQGSASGGTLHTILNLVEKTDLKKSSSPYYLNEVTKEKKDKKNAKDQLLPKYNKELNTWTGPFIMASANSRVVRRTHSILENIEEEDSTQNSGLHQDFSYNENLKCGNAFIAWITTIFLAIFGLCVLFPPTRKLVKKIIPKQGDGPSKAKRDKSYFVVDSVGKIVDENNNEEILTSRITGGDPGYDETAKMVVNAGMCLVLNRDECAVGGVLTPASAFGYQQIERLDSEGITFTLK